MSANLIGSIEAAFRKATLEAANKARNTLQNAAQTVIGSHKDSGFHTRGSDSWHETKRPVITPGTIRYKYAFNLAGGKSFYGGYMPKQYQRTGNFESSFRTYVDSSHHKTGNSALNRSAVLHFSTQYMPYDTHISRSFRGKGSPYPKGLVMETAFDHGVHGYDPNDGNYKKTPIGSIKNLNSTTGIFVGREKGYYIKTTPSPAEHMEAQLHRMLHNKNFIHEIQENIAEGVTKAILSEIDKELK